MTKAKAKSEFHKGTTIPNTLLDELMEIRGCEFSFVLTLTVL